MIELKRKEDSKGVKGKERKGVRIVSHYTLTPLDCRALRLPVAGPKCFISCTKEEYDVTDLFWICSRYRVAFLNSSPASSVYLHLLDVPLASHPQYIPHGQARLYFPTASVEKIC